MNVIVTGGKGFIGSYLVKKLTLLKHKVTVIDRNNTGEELKGVKYICADLQNFDKVYKYFKGVDAVFHMAADVSIHKSFLHPVECGNNNTISTHNVLDACRMYKVKKIIFSSTSALYKESKVKVKETDSTDFKNIYAASKLYCESLCKIYRDLYELDIYILRYFNVFGSRQEDSLYPSAITSFLQRKFNNKPLTIYGNGNQSRDFVYVEDVVDANVLALKSSRKIHSLTYNVGSGRSIKIKEIAKIISKNLEFREKRTGEIFYSCANNSLIKKELSWKPKVNLETWIKKQIKQ